jgi:hypothetical protein
MNTKAQTLKQMIIDNGSKFMGVEFIKADGTTRVLNGRFAAAPGHDGENTVAHIEKYVTILLNEKSATGKPQFRNVNTTTIKALHLGGMRIVVPD